MLHYFYHLEYPEVQPPVEPSNGGDSAPTSQVGSPITAASPAGPAKSRNGSLDGAIQAQAQPPQQQQQRVMEYSIEKEQFIDPATVPAGGTTGETSSEAGAKSRKKKKKSRMNSVESSDALTNTTTNNSSSNNTASTAPTAQTTTQQPEVKATATTTTTHHPNLTLDARVYAVARKYGVAALASTAAERFERGVAAHWGTTDFLRAAREAYTSTERGDRRLRDAVLAAVHAHPELLARADVQDVVRGLELSFDLLMYLRGDAAGAKGGGGGGGGQRVRVNGGAVGVGS